MSTKDAIITLPRSIEGKIPHLLIARAPYYKKIVDGLTEGALVVLKGVGATSDIMDTAGAYELPQVLGIAARAAKKYDGFILLGCIIKGETDHYDFICQATMQGIIDIASRLGVCVGTGLLTCHTISQALARSGSGLSNKGSEAAAAALGQISIARYLGST